MRCDLIFVIMSFRIQTSVDDWTIRIAFSGSLDHEGIAELRRLFDQNTNGHQLVLDLEELGQIDGNGIRALAAFESYGVHLVNSPMYVRDWIALTTIK